MGGRATEGGSKAMIDWNSESWGGGVTYASDGSWVADKHDDESDLQD